MMIPGDDATATDVPLSFQLASNALFQFLFAFLT